jgi:hypothetical protein
MLQVLLRLFLLCGVGLSAWVQAAELTATRLWPSPEYTRITLESSQPIAHKYFQLSNPIVWWSIWKGLFRVRASMICRNNCRLRIPTSQRSARVSIALA